MKITYEIADIVPYINWVYFYHAWGMSGKSEAERRQLRREAEEALARLDGQYHAYALFQLFDACCDGDDIVVFEGVRSQEDTMLAPTAIGE